MQLGTHPTGGREEIMERKIRQANYEALRILAMLMVITMHYLQKGGMLLSLTENTEVSNLLAWLVETLCIGAANAYVLISGYFLVEASWKWQKLVWLVAQVWVYSVGVSLFCLALSIGNVSQWGFYDWIRVIFPISSEHYWFATAYLLFYLFVPVLQAGVRQLSRKQHQVLLGGVLVGFSLIKTLCPVLLPTDRYGYDFGWFMVLFLVAAYLKVWGLPVLEKGKRALLFFFGTAGLIWSLNLGMSVLVGKGLPLSYMRDMLYSYNHGLVLLLSVGLFAAFGKWKVKSEKVRKAVLRIAPYTFGVYLLHEHIALRNLWQGWLGIERVRESLAFLPHMLIAVLVIFMVGTAVDFIRSCLFGRLAVFRKGDTG